MKRILLVAAIVGLTACTVDDEAGQELDVTEPRFSVSINGVIAYSTISQNWGPITCDDGSIPSFNPTGSTTGIAVPLEEAGIVPSYPVEIDVVGMDSSGIRTIMVSGPIGIYVPEAPATVSTPTSQFAVVRSDFGLPYMNAKGMSFRYSRDGTSSIRFRVTVYDGAASSNSTDLLLDIAPESELCS